jgi:hypothetical protein
MSRFREHMEGHAGRLDPNDLSERKLRFSPGSASPRRSDAAAAALDLVYEAGKIFECLENRVIKSESCARQVTESAREKLRLAEARIQSTEAARRAAEETLNGFKSRLREIESEFQQARNRIAALEFQLVLAEKRVIAAEARADNAENAIRKIECVLRTQFFGKKRNETDSFIAAA